MTQIQSLLAANLKDARTKLGLSQAGLAERCNISTSFVGEMEIGRKFPSPKNLQGLADALGLKPYQLFFDHSDWKDFDRFQTLSQFSTVLKDRLAADIDQVTTQFLSQPGKP
jgi:transcriptional regulator with XRE-family HTH domain